VKKGLLFFVMALLATSANAEVYPQSGTGDPRVQYVAYDPQQVVILKVVPGYQLALEFQPGEQAMTISLGNAAVWFATPSHDGAHVFVKPMRGAVPTDMAVITNMRSYVFKLEPADDALSSPFIVRFTYANAGPATSDGTIVHNYSLKGDVSLFPSTIYDNGVSTFILWAGDLPAIYSADDAGNESLVNGGMRNGLFVIDEVDDHLVFRAGALKATATRNLP